MHAYLCMKSWSSGFTWSMMGIRQFNICLVLSIVGSMKSLEGRQCAEPSRTKRSDPQIGAERVGQGSNH